MIGVPTVPGSDKPVTDDLEAEHIARSLFDFQKEQGVGNPVILIKASAGGGGAVSACDIGTGRSAGHYAVL